MEWKYHRKNLPFDLRKKEGDGNGNGNGKLFQDFEMVKWWGFGSVRGFFYAQSAGDEKLYFGAKNWSVTLYLFCTNILI